MTLYIKEPGSKPGENEATLSLPLSIRAEYKQKDRRGPIYKSLNNDNLKGNTQNQSARSHPTREHAGKFHKGHHGWSCRGQEARNTGISTNY
jgi:hypothetical protein